MSRVGSVMERAKAAAIQVVRAVQRERAQQERAADMSAARTATRDRGMSLRR
jgi:hypothetical protein